MFVRSRRLTALVCALLLASSHVQPVLAEDPPNLERRAAAYEATAEALDKIVAGVPHADFEVEALAAMLEGDADAMTAWVAANTAHGSYRGELKGAAGTLEDRRGNSLDRALLLAALVHAKSGTVRLARGMLDNETTARLAAAIATESYTPAPALAAALTDPILADLAQDPRVNGAAMKAGRESAGADAAGATAASDALSQKASAKLLEIVGARLPGAISDADSALLLADHWWVQIEEGGAWRDLDPDAAIVGAQNATETMAVDAVPDAEKHRVTLRVVAESAPAGGALTTATVIERSYDTAAINGRVLSLSTQPLDAPGFGALAASPDGVTGSYRAGSAWMPALMLDQPDVQSIVMADGSLIEASAANVARLTGGTASLLDSNAAGLDQIGTGGEEPAKAPPGGLFTAAWLEFDIATPGAPLRSERRIVFDAIGAEARASGSYAGDLTDLALAMRGQKLRDVYSIVIQGGAIAPARAAGRFAASVAMARRVVADWLRTGAGEAGPTFPDEFRPPNLELTAWSMGRAGDAGLAGTNIALLRDTARIDENGLTMIQVFDIVANPVAARDGASRLRAGVADTALEHQLMGAPESSVNTAVAFVADLRAGKPWALVTQGDEAALDALALSPEAAALVAADLARGALVVARPGAALAQATWWRIDPATGETVGMSAAGGAETLEYVIGVSLVISTFGVLTIFRCQMAGGRGPGQNYAECAAASFANPFTLAGDAVKKKIGAALDGASKDPLSGF